MRLIIIILLFVQCSLSAQQKSTIILGDGSGTPVAGSDSLGRNGTAGQIVFETATKAGNSSANLFWDNSTNRLGIGTNTPSVQVHSYKATGLNYNVTQSGTDFVSFFASDAFGPAIFGLNTSSMRFGASGDMLGGTFVEHARITGASGNFLIGAAAAGTSAAKVIGIANGTAPTTSPANMVQLWAEDVSASSELRVRDEAGNVTTLSPHNFSLIGEKSHELAWSFYSEKDGMAINVDMFRVVQLLEELTGEKLIHIKSIN